MVEKMKFLSFTGPRDDIDRLVEQYLSRYEIHLENALAQLGDTQGHVMPFLENNPYRESYSKACELIQWMGGEEPEEREDGSVQVSMKLIQQLDSELSSLRDQEKKLQAEVRRTEKSMKELSPFRSLPCELKTLFHFEFIRCRFGRISRQYYENFKNYIYDNLETVLYVCSEDESYVWVVYFVTRAQQHKVNAVFSSLHFERVYLEDSYEDTPENEYQFCEKQRAGFLEQIRGCRVEMTRLLQNHAVELFSARDRLEQAVENFDVRKLAGCVREKKDNYYILCGWMAERDADRLMAELEDDEDIVCVADSDHNDVSSKPPTKLKNFKLIRPFEMYVRMYGVPGYREMDPTFFVAITYSFIFGAMFGDVGQGLCLAIGGFLLYHFKKLDLAGIIGTAGIFSTLFGFLFGSFFGFEDVLPALWLRPVTAMMDVPLLGRMNTVFVIAIGFGMCLNLLVMVLHIISGLRSKDPERSFLDANALAGLVFYGSLLAMVLLLMNGHALPSGIVLVVMFVIPLLIIGLKEPIVNLLEKKKAIPEGKAIFFVQAFFELFDVCLSYFSNTVSFVRIGAFAVSHAAMMEVVLMLAGAEAGSPNWVVVVLGNIFVCAMEGLIVGIQVLRLEYYELFSRFYQGDGKEFVSSLKPKKENRRKKA